MTFNITPFFYRERYEKLEFTPDDVKNLKDKETGDVLVTEEEDSTTYESHALPLLVSARNLRRSRTGSNHHSS